MTDSTDAAPPMHLYQVGALYHPGRTRWPEGPHLRLAPNGCELVLFYANPTAAEVRDVKSGVPSFALTVRPHVAVLAYRFGTQPWSDAPFEAHRQPEGQRGRLAGAVGSGDALLLHLLLVDAATGVIKTQRALSWPASFADAMRAMVADQLAAPYDAASAGRELGEVYRLDSQALIDSAAARC